VDGVLVVGSKLSVTGGTLSVFYDDSYFYNPPQGFTASTVMTLVPGSYVQVTN
jgi:hypothetical protein